MVELPLKNPDHWLLKHTPQEWIRVALAEVRNAEAAYGRHDARGGFTGAKRAAGMGLNAALIVEPNEKWGRTYVEHVRALSSDTSVPQAVRAACDVLLESDAPGITLVRLRSPNGDERVLEAARDVIAHAYWVLMQHGLVRSE